MNDHLAQPLRGDAPRAGAACRTGQEAAVLGLPMLLELFDGSHEAVAELLEAARASIVHDVERIATAANACDRRGLIEAGHRLKGTSGSISAERLHVVSSAIELAARDDEPAAVAPLLAELDAAAAVTAAAIGFFAAASGDRTSAS